MELTEQQIQRYSRQIILSDVGGKGQMKLSKAKVLLIGAGGLGSPAGLYLAAAGVGTIGLVDGDVVDLSNLQRQILHSTATVGLPKVESGRKTLSAINPEITIKTYHQNVDSDNILPLVSQFDIVLDGSDNFATRFLVNDACFFAKKTLISASMFRFEGQLTTISSHADILATAALPGATIGWTRSELPRSRCLRSPRWNHGYSSSVGSDQGNSWHRRNPG
jgi:adenylyltransferase/sulfurtransferase